MATLCRQRYLKVIIKWHKEDSASVGGPKITPTSCKRNFSLPEYFSRVSVTTGAFNSGYKSSRESEQRWMIELP